MDLVFVVPGIMGSELYLGQTKLWPPRPLLNVTDPDRLLDPQVVAGDLIRRVFVFGFYDKLLKPLERWGYREHQPGNNGLVVTWPYNWTRAIPETARSLAADLRSMAALHSDKEIVLLAHSMGGLICTYALECLADPDDAWRERVRLLVTFGTPFHGAPESLKNAFGLEGVMGITAPDCHRLMADPGFPSAYQLLPHLSTLSIWSGDSPLPPLDSYQALDPFGPQLDGNNLTGALAIQSELQTGTASGNTRKFNFCGSRHRTAWTAVAAQGQDNEIEVYESKAGDGTVPSWSGRQRHDVQFAPLGAKHSATFGDDYLLDVLYELLTRPASPPKPPRAQAPTVPRPPPSSRSQPRVSVTQNAVSSLRASIEVEVFEPPADGILQLCWVRLEQGKSAEHDVGSPDDLQRYLSAVDFDTIVARHSIPMGPEADFPLQLSIARPNGVGQFALVAWSGEPTRNLEGLDAERMDVVWVFADEGRGRPTTDGHSIGEDPVDSASRKRKDEGEQETVLEYMAS